MSNQNIARSTFWLIVSEIIFNLSGYVIHSFVARILGPSDYGRYGLVVTLTTMVIILIGNGIPTAMAKYISEIFETNPSMVLAIKRKAITLQTAIIGTITVLFYFSAPLIANALNDPSLTSLFRISTLIIPAFAAASFYFSFYTGLHKFNVQSILKTLRSLLKVAAIVGLAWAFSVPGSILGYALAAFSVFLIGFGLDQLIYTKNLKKASKAQNLPQETTFESSKLVNYAWQVILFFLAYELLISIDLYLVKGILRDDFQTGIYNAALTVGRIPYYIFYALTIMLLPVVSKTTAEQDTEKTNEVVAQSLRLMVILLIPSVVIMAQFAEPIITLFYSAKYATAALPMAILSYGVGFLTIFYVMSFVLNGAGKTKVPMVISIFGVIINTILNYVLIQKFALVGSAIATSISSFVIMVIMLWYIQTDFGVLIQTRSIAKMLSAAIVMFFVSFLLPAGSISFIFSSIILFAIYLALLFFMQELSKKDLQYILSIVGRKKKKKQVQEDLSGNEPSA